MDIMILGGSGVVGHHLDLELKKGHNVKTVSKTSKSSSYNIDALDFQSLENLISDEKPDVVINAIKPPLSTDRMEEEKQLSYKVNTLLPERIAQMQERHMFKYVHMSTVWVYEGKKGETYSEESLTYVKNYYSLTKLLAEERIRLISKDYIIARTEGVYGIDEKGTNLFLRIRNATASNPVQLTDDQFSQPIYSGELARIIRTLIEKGANGIFNTVGPDLVSRYEFGLRMVKSFNFGKETIKPFSVKDRKLAIPEFLKVDISKVERVTGKTASLEQQFEMLKKAIA